MPHRPRLLRRRGWRRQRRAQATLDAAKDGYGTVDDGTGGDRRQRVLERWMDTVAAVQQRRQWRHSRTASGRGSMRRPSGAQAKQHVRRPRQLRAHLLTSPIWLQQTYTAKRSSSLRTMGISPDALTPTSLLDSRDPFDLQLPQIGPRMIYGNIDSHEAFLRRKLEEQRQTAELQQAIELHGRRCMGLHLLDLKSRGHHHLNSPVGPRQQTDGNGNGNGNAIHLEDAIIQEKKRSSVGLASGSSTAHSKQLGFSL